MADFQKLNVSFLDKLLGLVDTTEFFQEIVMKLHQLYANVISHQICLSAFEYYPKLLKSI